MNSALRRHQKILVVLLCMGIHALLMISIAVMEMKDFAKSPTIIFEDFEPAQNNNQDQENTLTELDNSFPSFPATQSNPVPALDSAANAPIEHAENTTQEIEAEPKEKQDFQEEIALEKSLDDALTIATQMLKKASPTEKKDSPQESKPSEKKLTLAHIAQGFMNQVHQNAAMTVQSDTNGAASIEQLKHLNYCKKIIGCLVSSYKINKYNAPKEEQPGRACIQLVINHDGTIHTLRVVQSSGNLALDQFLIHMFKDASSSFPPVPQSFSQKPYHLPLFNIDHIESFQTSQHWYIDSRRS